jgi:hypothetical protein
MGSRECSETRQGHALLHDKDCEGLRRQWGVGSEEHKGEMEGKPTGGVGGGTGRVGLGGREEKEAARENILLPPSVFKTTTAMRSS